MEPALMPHSLISRIQEILSSFDLDGWLFFDHHYRDPLAYEILGLPTTATVSRRWYYLIPRTGEPQALLHRIEPKLLDSLPAGRHFYSSWQSHAAGVEKLMHGLRRVALQYSPNCAIPYVSLVDGGTLELIRATGVEVVSSADLIQIFHATLAPAQIESHFAAAAKMDAIRRAAFAEAAAMQTNEWALYLWLREAFEREGLTTDHGPIVGVNAHAADPHYEPSSETSQPIRPGDLLLIDMWAKLKTPGAVYYDITWTGYCGASAPSEVENVFTIVRDARDAAIRRVADAFAADTPIHGFEVDDAARGHIVAAGYGDAFVHRTGHSITTDIHGAGANMDNLETHDTRRILPGTLFSVEPGIYLPNFGIRSECNVLARKGSASVTGELQRSLLLL
jgi:Xaa-Pro aminopeptidase